MSRDRIAGDVASGGEGAGTGPRRGPRPFQDRVEAGEQLAEQLVALGVPAPIVLAIPRGGVPLGFAIARRLGAPLDVLLVRKVGAPGDPEYGLGAVAEGGLVQLDEPRARAAGFSRADLEPVVRRELAEVDDRARRFRGDRAPPDIVGRTVVVVDDGVATGGTVETAVRVLRAGRARSVVAALGVAPVEAVARLRALADEVVVALVPPYLEAVGQWYRRFEPIDDDEVARLLEAARSSEPAPRP